MEPILFNTGMVKAILDGRKTVTRRVVKPQPRAIYHGGTIWDDEGCQVILVEAQNGRLEQITVPYRPGDILYVRETWARYREFFLYRTNCPDTDFMLSQRGVTIKWRSPIHMPKEAARLFLRVINVRVERLQDITEEQAEAEGCSKWYEGTEVEIPAASEFCNVWDNTIKKADLPLYGWAANPWVWVIEFERISKEEAPADG